MTKYHSKKNLRKFSILYWKLLTHTCNGKFSILVYDFFTYQRMETRECMENFQAQTKNLFMGMVHLNVRKKAILSYGIFAIIFYVLVVLQSLR